jgi:hypothetical protein
LIAPQVGSSTFSIVQFYCVNWFLKISTCFNFWFTGKPASQVITCESPSKASLVPVRLMPTKWKAVDSSESALL